MGDQYYERKIRVYEPRRKQEGGKLEKYAFNPMKKMFGMNKKKDDYGPTPEQRRLVG